MSLHRQSLDGTHRWFLCSPSKNKTTDHSATTSTGPARRVGIIMMSEGVWSDSWAADRVWAAGWVRLLGRVLPSVRVDAQSSRGLARRRRSPLARVLKTFGRLISCVQTSYKADECPMHSLYHRECIPQAFLSCLWTPVEISYPQVAPSWKVAK